MTATRRSLLAASLLMAFAVSPVQAQAWPQKPIKIIVTFNPGGSSDIVARLLQPGLQEKLGQPVVVENKPGAGSTIGADAVAKSPADGYTLLLSNTAPISISPFMMDKAPYDPVKSFSHVAHIGSVPNVFVVHPSVPAKTMPELIKWIGAQSTPVNYGSGGVGSIGHIVGEMAKSAMKIQMTHIPYKGGAPMTTDLISGQIPVGIDVITAFVPMVKDGKIRALAVTTRTRSPLLPDVPTVTELGLPQLVAENYSGVSGPAGLPAEVIDKLNGAIDKILVDPAIVKRFEELGLTVAKGHAPEFTAFVAKQVADWAPVIKAADLKP